MSAAPTGERARRMRGLIVKETRQVRGIAHHLPRFLDNQPAYPADTLAIRSRAHAATCAASSASTSATKASSSVGSGRPCDTTPAFSASGVSSAIIRLR